MTTTSTSSPSSPSSSPSSSSTSFSPSSITTATPFTLIPAYRSSTSSSTIPFSWEQQPGIPKLHYPNPAPAKPHPSLPLPPPPIRPLPSPRKKRPDYDSSSDPFAAALVECSKPNPRRNLLPPSSQPNLSRRSTKERLGFGFGVGFGLPQSLRPFDIYGSCRSSEAVADSTVLVRRPDQQMVAYSLLHRRRG